MYYRKTGLLLMLFLMIVSSLQAQVIEKSKSYNRVFSLQKSTEVGVSNKYGNVHLVLWEKDSVRFQVDVLVRSSKQSKVDKIFNEIDIKFTQTPYYVNAVSTFAQSGGLWSEISDVTKQVINSGNETEINYTVYLPKWAKVSVENRFGNIYTTEHQNESEFKLSNGILQAKSLIGKTKITVSFGSVNIGQINEGSIELNYSDLDLQRVEKLHLSGRSSTVLIGAATEINLDSRRDKINIEELKSISGMCSFSRLTMGMLNRDMLLSTNYGSVNLNNVSKQMQFFQLDASYTTIQVFVQSQSAADFEIVYSKRAKLNVPNTMTIIEKTTPASDSESGILKSSFGKEKGSSYKFNLMGGELNILEKFQ